MHAVVYNPAEPRLIATANAKEGVGLWDIRRPKAWVCVVLCVMSTVTLGTHCVIITDVKVGSVVI